MPLKHKKRVIAYVHSHWDREWYREFEEFRLRLIEVFDKVLRDLQSGSLEKFYFDAQTAALEDYLEIFPEKEFLVKEFISSKKIYIGPFYCSTDSLLTSSESMIRNLYFGIKKSRDFGCDEYIGYLSDTFGHSPCMSKILLAFGIDKAMMWRGIGDYKSELKWEDTLVTNLIQGYFQDFLSLDVAFEKKAEYLEKYIKKIEARSNDVILLPIGADHLCTPDNLDEQIKKFNNYFEDYKIEIGTPFDYFEAVKNEKRENIKGELLDNSKTFILPGVYSSRIYLKQKNADIQWRLSRIVEPLQSVCEFEFGAESRQNQLDYAYKTLIKNHAHDSIYGCSIDAVHDEMITRFEKIAQVADGIKKRAIRDITCENAGLKLLNLSNYSFSGLIELEMPMKLDLNKYDAKLVSSRQGFPDSLLFDSGKIPVTEDYTTLYRYVFEVCDLPPLSVVAYKKESKNACDSIKSTDSSIENDFIKIEVVDGKIVLTDKINNNIYNDFISISDRADVGDSYNFGALSGDKKIFANLRKYKLIDSNKLFAKFKCDFDIEIPAKSVLKGRSKKTYKTKLTLYSIIKKHSKNIEFEISCENKSTDHILQIEFNLGTPITTTISEDMSGTIERTFNPDFDIYKKIPAQRGIELKPNTAPFQRFVLANGVGFITKGLNEYEVVKNKLALTILRATGTISNPKNPTRGTPAGPPLPTPKLQCLGNNCANFAVCFTQNSTDMFKQAEEFYGAIIPVFSDKNDSKILKLNNENILVYAAKMSGFGLTFRLHNISDKPQNAMIKTDLAYKNIYELTPLEEKIKEVQNIIEFEPREIKTIAFTK